MPGTVAVLVNGAVTVLLIEPIASDRELAELVLRGAFADCDCLSAHNAVELLNALSGRPPEICILSLSPGWAPAREMLAIIRRQAPATAIVMLGTREQIASECLSPGTTIDAIVCKDSAGFLALPGIIDELRGERNNAVNDAALELEQIPVPAFLADADGRLSAINNAMADRLHVAPADCRLLQVAELCADDHAAATWRSFVDGLAPSAEIDCRLNGEAVRLHLSRDPSRPPRHRIVGVMVAVEATELSMVSTRRPHDPGRGESDDIALVFSHDLKEPLQQIRRLTQQLSGNAPPDIARTVEQLDVCAARAGGMLNSVLDYLLVTTRDAQPGQVDLNRCLEEALDNLRGEIEASDAKVVSDQLPAIAGDAFQFVHLFQNLIGNAVKFRGREAPEVRITAGSAGSKWRLTISDNGIGVPEAHREHVFDIGKRLHTRDEYPGAGIGLTLCRRIVERHGGAIRFEPGDSSGACIVIELPRGPERVHANA